MKLPEPVTISITTVGGILIDVTLGVSRVMCTESTEWRELTEEELDLARGYALQLAVAIIDNNEGEVERLQNLLKALRAKPKPRPTTRGGHALA
jgi:hypothetical protein